MSRPEEKPAGRYLYCLFASGEIQNFDLSGIAGHAVYAVHYQDLVAAVSNTPATYLEPAREHVLAHQKVTSAIMQKYTVLPVSFGTICKTEEELSKLLREIYPEAKKNLDRIKDKIEVGLKIFWNKETFLQEIGEADPNINRLKKEIAAAKEKGIDPYVLIIQLGQLVEEQVQRKRQSYLHLIYKPLLVHAAEARLNDPITEKMVLNAAFLINKDREAEFDQAVNNLYERFKNRLVFKYTGPWPPYNFVDIKITGV
ncbi:MAG: GvpL/GvpF family gas vesicle protein [Bacillota bacterium]